MSATTVPPGTSFRKPMSYAEYQALGETKHHEYYDGLCVVNPPNRRHVTVARRLTRVLEDACPHGYEVLPEWGWHVSDEEDYQPDIMVAAIEAPGADLLRAAPLLVVEITSRSTRSTDRGHKNEAYARGGAQWYWIVDPDASEVQFLQLTRGRYGTHGVAHGGETYDVTEPFRVQLRPDDLFA